MKFSKILLLLVITLSIVSCKNDDDTVAFSLSNANVTGTHDLTYFAANTETTVIVQMVPFTVSTTVTADTYQARVNFTEAGAFTLSGEFRTTTTITPGGLPPVVEIIVWNETGTYQVDDAAKTIVLIENGSTLGDSEINTVTLFNETELRVTYENMYTEAGQDIVEMSELRFVRQ